MMKKNIFLTGAPSSGKTTVIKKIIEKLQCPARGFYTEEEKRGDKRIGFVLKTLEGKSGYLAQEGIKTDYHIRRFGVSIENIEKIAVPSIIPLENHVIVLDEIGKMECFSDLFKKAALQVLDASNIVIGTIALGGDDFIKGIKRRDDMEIHEVTLDNRDILPNMFMDKIKHLLDDRKG